MLSDDRLIGIRLPKGRSRMQILSNVPRVHVRICNYFSLPVAAKQTLTATSAGRSRGPELRNSGGTRERGAMARNQLGV